MPQPAPQNPNSRLNPVRLRFPRAARILARPDFVRALEHGRRASDSRLAVWIIANDLPGARLGLNVGRRYGDAPDRNHFKRLLREAFRLQRRMLPAGYDIVCAPRGRGPMTCRDAVESLAKLVSRALQ